MKMTVRWEGNKLKAGRFTMASTEIRKGVYLMWIGDALYSERIEETLEEAKQAIEVELGIH
jgi:hypothetical protein